MLGGTFFSAISQILLKQSANIKYSNPLREYLNWRVILAYFLFFGILLLNTWCYTKVDMRYGPVIDTAAYVFVLLLSKVILKEKITPVQGACVFLAFIGCLFVVKPGFQNTALIPALIGVCGGLGAGIAYTMVRVLGTHGIKGPIIVFYFSVCSCLFVLPYLIFNYVPMTVTQLGTLLMAGLFAAGGQFTITAAYSYAPAGKISIFDYSQIIFATLLGFFLFGEIPDKYSFIGYGLIILASLGMFVYNMRAAKKN